MKYVFVKRQTTTTTTHRGWGVGGRAFTDAECVALYSHNLNIEIEVMDSFFFFSFSGHKNWVFLFVRVFQCLCFMLSTLTSSVKGSLDL